MPSQIYEILSLMMRYWFAALGVLIVLRAFWWLWKDHRSREKKRRSLPDAGSIGEFVVESDCAALPQDTLLPVPADGTLGSVRSCDIVVPARGVSPPASGCDVPQRIWAVYHPVARVQLHCRWGDGSEPEGWNGASAAA